MNFPMIMYFLKNKIIPKCMKNLAKKLFNNF